MDIKLLKIQVKGLNIKENDYFEYDFFAEKSVSEKSKMNNEVTHLFSSFYTLNTVAISGANASGKTTSLKIIELIFNIYLYGISLNDKKSIYDQGWLANIFDKKLEIISYFYKDNYIYKVYSLINKDLDNKLNPLVFEEEYIYSKKINNRTAKKEVFEFSEIDLKMQRTTSTEVGFLKPDDSMFFQYITNEYNVLKFDYVTSLVDHTNINIIIPDYERKIPLSLIKYLDNSIEVLEFDTPKSRNEIVYEFVNLKFLGKPKMRVRAIELENYLSSGTMKGINIIMAVKETLDTGGYLIIDEIENHLNKRIVIQIINFFMSKLNTKGATLIFSTHYSEILDIVPRTDSIYLLYKDEAIELEKMSNAMKNDRSDIKKSELLLSGELPTMPQYKQYKRMYMELAKTLEGDGFD